jgi:hypothetical protein
MAFALLAFWYAARALLNSSSEGGSPLEPK